MQLELVNVDSRRSFVAACRHKVLTLWRPRANEDFPLRAFKFYEHHVGALSRDTQAMVAFENGKYVGSLAYMYRAKDGYLLAQGTYVLPHARDRGVALLLWKEVLSRYTGVRLVDIWTTSKGGRRLTKAVKEWCSRTGRRVSFVINGKS